MNAKVSKFVIEVIIYFCYQIIYLLSTQVLPYMSMHRVAILLHTSLSAASRSMFSQLLFTLLRSFLKVLLQVMFGLPLFLFPRRGCHFIVIFAGRSSDILRMWPANLTLCSVTVSCRRSDCSSNYFIICYMIKI